MAKIELIRGTVAALLMATASSQAFADTEKVHRGRVMWTAFECATYAEMGGNKERMQALYKHGIEAGRDFIRAIRDNVITPEDLKKSVPVGVTMRLGGSSDDFMIGRIFEAALGEAYDKIVKHDNNGMLLESSNWIMDDRLKAAKAKTKYHTSNCDLIR